MWILLSLVASAKKGKQVFSAEINGNLFDFTMLTKSEVSIRNGPRQIMGNRILNIDSSVTHQEIVYSIIGVDEYSFKDTPYEEIILPSSITYLSNGAFSDSKYLKKIDLKETLVKVIPNECFSNSHLNSIAFSSSLSSISSKAFLGTSIIYFEFTPNLIMLPEEEGQFCLCSKLVYVNMSSSNMVIIPKNAFNGCIMLSKIIFPKNLESIYEGAFQNSALVELNLPSSVESIAEKICKDCHNLQIVNISTCQIQTIRVNSFQGCHSLHTFVDGGSITEIESSAFAGTNITSFSFSNLTRLEKYSFQSCKSLEKANFSESTLTVLNQGVFIGCTRLSEIILPPKIVNIKLSALMETNISNITIPENCTEIEIKAFACCKNLAFVDISAVIKIFTLQQSAFIDCNNLKTILLPQKLHRISEKSFQNIGIESLELSGELKILGQSSFADCHFLTFVNLTNTTLTTLKNSCFAGCENLHTLLLPQTVTTIETNFISGTMIRELKFYQLNLLEEGAFSGCSALQTLNLSVCTKITKLKKGLFKNSKSLTNIALPPSISRVEEECFMETNITEFIVPKSCEDVERGSFSNCHSLRKADFSQTSIKQISDNCFLNCMSLSEILLPKSLRRIGARAFFNTSFSEIDFPNTVESIKERAFAFNAKLTLVNLEKTYIESINSETFFNCSNMEIIKLPDKLDVIKCDAFAFTAVKFITRKSLDQTSIGAFRNCQKLKEVQINEIKSKFLPASIFEGCISLEKVTILSNIEKIGDNAFAGSGIISMPIPKTVNSLGMSVFANATQLTEVDLSEFKQIKEIPEYTFYGCSKLAVIKLPEDGITTFCDECFAGTAIKEITFPASTWTIGRGVCQNCHNLTKVDTSKASIDIPDKAFMNCTSLQSVKISAHLYKIGEYSFSMSSIRQFTFPQNLRQVGRFAFAFCHNLTRVQSSALDLQEIQQSAFFNCSGLQHIELPDGIIQIENSSFAFSAIEEVILPAVRAVGERCFEGCVRLKRADFSHANLKEISDFLFYGCSSLVSFTPPQQVEKLGRGCLFGTALDTYTAHTSISEIGESALANCTLLRNADLSGAKLTEIVNELFALSTSLKTVKIPKTVRAIGEGSFTRTAIQYFEFPAALEWIGGSAFAGTQLESANMTETIIRGIGAGSFMECASLAWIQLNPGCTEVDAMAFANCTSLTAVDLHHTQVARIGIGAFLGCASLKMVFMSPQLNTVGISALAVCPKLQRVIYCGRDPVEGSAIFDQGSSVKIYVLEEFPMSSFGGVDVLIADHCPAKIDADITTTGKRTKVPKPAEKEAPAWLIIAVSFAAFLLVPTVIFFAVRCRSQSREQREEDEEQREALLRLNRDD